jgi:hypothetical protein
MANEDVLSINTVTEKPLYELLTFLCHQQDVESIKNRNKND